MIVVKVKYGIYCKRKEHSDRCAFSTVKQITINSEDQSKLNGIRFGCNKLNRLFISHLHGDHIFGLPSVILGVSFERDPELNESSPIDIYGPSGLAEYLSTVFRVCESRISCKLNIHELCQWNQPSSCKCK